MEKIKIKKAVIIAAGYGTRFLPASKAIPKELFPVVDKPIIQYLVEDLCNAGIKEILIILSSDKTAIIKHFDKNGELESKINNEELKQKAKTFYKDCNCNIYFTFTPERNGVADALSYAKTFVAEQPFITLLGDAIFDGGNVIEEMLDCFEKFQLPLMLASKVDKEKVPNYGNIEASEIEQGLYVIEKIIEKPPLEKVKSELINTGVGIYFCNIFSIIESLRTPQSQVNLMDALQEIAETKKLLCLKTKYDFYDTGCKVGLLQANIIKALKSDKLCSEMKEFIKNLNLI